MQPRRVLFNTVLGAFARAGNFNGAKEWFAEGCQDGMEANTQGLGKLIDAAVERKSYRGDPKPIKSVCQAIRCAMEH
eukprot:3669925-Amphidinium_carterae.1